MHAVFMSKPNPLEFSCQADLQLIFRLLIFKLRSYRINDSVLSVFKRKYNRVSTMGGGCIIHITIKEVHSDN
jgi:hypothetical protein